MKNIKRILSTILSLTIIMCVLAASCINVSAEAPFNAVLAAFDDATGTLSLFGIGEMTTDHAKDWEGYKDRIHYVVIGDGITSIAPDAFNGCTSLAEVVIGNDVAVIGEEAFSECTKLEALTLPDSIKTIESDAFLNCTNLKTLKLGKAVTDINEDVLLSFTCEEFIVDEGNSAFSSQNGVLFNKDKTTLIKYPSHNKNTSYTVPDTVKIIGTSAFINCSNLESIDLPNSLTQINKSAFYNCEKLSLVNVNSSKSDFNKVIMGVENDSLTDARITYTDSSSATGIILAIAFIGVVILLAGIVLLKKKSK